MYNIYWVWSKTYSCLCASIDQMTVWALNMGDQEFVWRRLTNVTYGNEKYCWPSRDAKPRKPKQTSFEILSIWNEQAVPSRPKTWPKACRTPFLAAKRKKLKRQLLLQPKKAPDPPPVITNDRTITGTDPASKIEQNTTNHAPTNVKLDNTSIVATIHRPPEYDGYSAQLPDEFPPPYQPYNAVWGHMHIFT
jgi:hypothetical protein